MKYGIFPRHKKKIRRQKPRPTAALGYHENAGLTTGHLPDDQDLAPHTPLDETSERRAQRVAELREQVRSGTYEIPFSQLVRVLTSFFLQRPR